MGQHFLTECFLSENADLIKLKSCVGCDYFNESVLRKGLLWLKIMFLVKNQRVKDSRYKCQQPTI